MSVGESGDLWQMGHAQHLVEAGKLLELASDDLRHSAAYAGVDLVENHSRDTAALRFQALEREHHTRELAA